MKLEDLVSMWDRSEYPVIFSNEAKKLLNVAGAVKDFLNECENGVSYDKYLTKLELLKIAMRELERE